MLYSERSWAEAQTADLDHFTGVLKHFCARRFVPDASLAKSVTGIRWELKHYCCETAPYLLARYWQVYSLPIDCTQWPLWLHERDVPTMQAAHAKDERLIDYLRSKYYMWSSNQIAADLRVDVWAARVCLDLLDLETPRYGNKPPIPPAAELDFRHDGVLTSQLLARGLNTTQVATELGVTPKFLRDQWKALHINPVFDRVRDRSSEATKPRNEYSEIAIRRETWIAHLKRGLHRGKVTRDVKSVGDAQHTWGVTYATARARLVALGWTPGEGVDTWLAAQLEAE